MSILFDVDSENSDDHESDFLGGTGRAVQVPRQDRHDSSLFWSGEHLSSFLGWTLFVFFPSEKQIASLGVRDHHWSNLPNSLHRLRRHHGCSHAEGGKPFHERRHFHGRDYTG